MKKIPSKEAIRLTQLWQNFGPNTYPIDISELIGGIHKDGSLRDGLETRIDDFESIEGALVRIQNSNNWTILLNSRIKNARRFRFTYAHELGHFMCHRHLRPTFEDGDESLNDFNNQLELEANIFASWLLMPANLLRAEFESFRWDIATLKEIGSRFECSLQASALRYVDLFSNRRIAFVVSRDGMILWSKKSQKAPYMNSFVFGDELPPGSAARSFAEGTAQSSAEVHRSTAWCDSTVAAETCYFDGSGLGYQYTCVEFETAFFDFDKEEAENDLVDKMNEQNFRPK